MSDLLTMLWKESRELLFGKTWKDWISTAVLVGVLGIYLPLQEGGEWLQVSALMVVVACWIPFSAITSFIGDAIAGERERHTLETLLASRISDRAILLGKVIVTVAYAWGLALVSLLLGFVVVNLVQGQGQWTFYQPLDLFLEVLGLCLLTCLLGTSAGVLISLRVATVRQAQQILAVGTLVLIFGGVIGLQALPEAFLASLSYSQAMGFFISVVAVVDAVLLALAFASFRRSRLILG